MRRFYERRRKTKEAWERWHKDIGVCRVAGRLGEDHKEPVADIFPADYRVYNSRIHGLLWNKIADMTFKCGRKAKEMGGSTRFANRVE